MKIEIDLAKLISNDISSDEYIFLYLLLLGKEKPDVIVRKIDPVPLQDKGFIKIVDEGFIARPKLKSMLATTIETTTVESWIDDWRNIWPKGYKSGGKPLRGTKADCIRKMKAFLRRTNYTKDDVFTAAQAYILDRKKNNYQYTTIANYFIQKDSDSSLESWCEMISEEGDSSSQFTEFHKEV